MGCRTIISIIHNNAIMSVYVHCGGSFEELGRLLFYNVLRILKDIDKWTDKFEKIKIVDFEFPHTPNTKVFAYKHHKNGPTALFTNILQSKVVSDVIDGEEYGYLLNFDDRTFTMEGCCCKVIFSLDYMPESFICPTEHESEDIKCAEDEEAEEYEYGVNEEYEEYEEPENDDEEFEDFINSLKNT